MLLRGQPCTVEWTLNYIPVRMEIINKISEHQQKWNLINLDSPNIIKKGGVVNQKSLD